MLAAFALLATGSCKTKGLKHGYVRDRKVNSFRQVIELKDGFLLIMLHEGKSKCTRLRELGLDELADQAEQRQRGKNLGIINTFRQQFHFCPVYFFGNSQAEKFLAYGIDSITFIDDKLQYSDVRPPRDKKFLVGEFDRLQMDTAKYFSGYRLSTTDTGAWQKPSYYSTSTFVFQAYIVESPQLVQLRRPFKYYVWIIETKNKILFMDSIIRKTNRRLARFHKRAKHKITVPRFKPYFTDLQ